MLVRLGDILGVGGMDSHEPLFFEEAVQSWDGAGITALHEFYPENNQPCVRVAPAHIGNQFDFQWSMLVWVVAGSSGEVTQGFDGAVAAAFPAVDVLPVGFVLNGGFCNAESVGIFNKG